MIIDRRTFLRRAGYGLPAAGLLLPRPALSRLAINNLAGFGARRGGGGGGAADTSVARLTTVTNAVDSTDPGGGTLTQSHTTDADTDMLVVIARTHDNGSPGNHDVTDVTFDGVSLTKITENNADTVRVNCEIWVMANPAIKAANVVVTYSGTVASASFTALNYKNVALVGAAQVGGSTSGTAQTASITTFFDNSVVVAGGLSYGADSNPYSPAGGSSEIADGDSGGGSSSQDHGYWANEELTTTAGAYTVGSTANVSDGWSLCAIELAPTASIMPSLVQSKSAQTSNSDTVAATFDATPTTGNLLVAAITMKGTGAAVTINTPSGWTLVGSQLQTDWGVPRSTTAIFWKESAGSEDTATITSPVTDIENNLFLYEFDGLATPTIDVSASVDETGGTGLVSASGTTAASVAAPAIAIAICNIFDDNFDVPTSASWTGDYIQTGTESNSGSAGTTSAAAYKLLRTSAAQATTCTFTTGGAEERAGFIATFKAT